MPQVVATIRQAADGPAAAEALQAAHGLSPEQTEGVLNLSLRRLTGLETQKLQTEADALTSRWHRCRAVTEGDQTHRKSCKHRRSIVCAPAYQKPSRQAKTLAFPGSH